MLYLVTISEQHLGIYEVLIHKLEQYIEALHIWSTGYLPITLTSPSQLTALQKAVPDHTPLFLDLCYYYGMKVISLGYDKDSNKLL